MEVPVRVGPQPINHGVQPRQAKTPSATTPSHTVGGMVRARTDRPAPRRKNQSLFACFGSSAPSTVNLRVSPRTLGWHGQGPACPWPRSCLTGKQVCPCHPTRKSRSESALGARFTSFTTIRAVGFNLGAPPRGLEPAARFVAIVALLLQRSTKVLADGRLTLRKSRGPRRSLVRPRWSLIPYAD